VRLLLSAYRYGALDINANASCTQYDCDEYTYNSLSPYPLTDMLPETVVFLRHAVLLHLMASRRTKPTIIKTHNANIRAGDVDLIPASMTAGAVYLIRDPRDVAVSFARHTAMTIDQAITSMNEDENLLRTKLPIASWLTTWSRHVRSWCKQDVKVVRYEDLKDFTADEFGVILDAFKIKKNKQRISKAVRLCEIDRLRKQEQKKKFIEIGQQDKFFGQGAGWQNELTENQVRRIEMDHGEVMQDYGYALEYL